MIPGDSKNLRADAPGEHWVAELATAAYLVALRHCATNQWLDLQLELWRALSAAIAIKQGDIAVSDDFLAELAYVAYRIALPYGCPRSFLDLELELYQTLRRAVERRG